MAETPTERAISEREKESRAAWMKRKGRREVTPEAAEDDIEDRPKAKRPKV